MGRKTVSVFLSVVFGAAGILLIYNFFSTVSGIVIDFVFGACLLFLAVYNIILTVKSPKK